MIASNYLLIIAIGLVVIGGEMRVLAEGDVTIDTPPPAITNAPTEEALTPDGTPVIHKSLHKKKPSGFETAATSATPPAVSPSLIPTPPSTASAKTIPPAYWAPGPNPVHTATTPTTLKETISFGPAVETGLPVARHTHADDVATLDPTPIPITATVPSGTYNPGATPHKVPAPATSSGTVFASAIPGLPSVTPAVLAPTLYTHAKKLASSTDEFAFSPPTHKPRNIYPWKKDIITTIFWIGEGDTPISRTTNEASAWDEDWRRSNGGSDSPDERNGYASAYHAARVNPFYLALPFNDLAFPDKARRWLPAGWYRAPKDGKQVSACRNRWVEIKNQQGRSCFAQWEDVGPLRYDHAEYVFGSERPDTYTRAGLDVAPAVAQYLNLNEKNHLTSWRFVDDEDVPPGVWLKYGEEAVLFNALHESKSLPIQKAMGPLDDSSDIDTNKKKVGAAKG